MSNTTVTARQSYRFPSSGTATHITAADGYTITITSNRDGSATVTERGLDCHVVDLAAALRFAADRVALYEQNVQNYAERVLAAVGPNTDRVYDVAASYGLERTVTEAVVTAVYAALDA